MFYKPAINVRNVVSLPSLYTCNTTFPVCVMRYSSPSDKQRKAY